MDLVVTTIQKPTHEVSCEAAKIAEQLGVLLVTRDKYSLPAIRESYGVSNILVMSKAGPIVHTPGGEYFFHLSMAELRIKNLINGNPDHMTAAMDLKAGMKVLDCTLGLATDAIVASYVVGAEGTVLGLESSPVISAVTGLGLQHYRSDNAALTAALRRVAVENADYNEYLVSVPDKSFDIVFFDPMFRVPISTSSNLKPVRFLADRRPVRSEAVQEACRVAKHRVVFKEAQNSPEFARLHFTSVIGGKYSSIHYGIIETGECPWND